MNILFRTYCPQFIILVIALFFSVELPAQQAYSETELKAAYVVKFGKFVAWPQLGEQMVLGIVGTDPFGAILETMANPNPDKPKWLIEHYYNANEIANCNILFISKDNTIPLANILQAIEGKSILTIGDELEQFCETGGMIKLNDSQAARPFWINLQATHKVCLKVNPQVLRIAYIYGEVPHGNMPCK